MIIFAYGDIKEETYSRPKPKNKILSEWDYWKKDKDKLKHIACPNCGEHELFCGYVYIGCTGCLQYFKEVQGELL